MDEMLHLTTYTDAGSFLDHAQALLEQHEANNNLILGFANAMIRNPNRYQERALLTVDDEHGVQGAALWMSRSHLMLHVEDSAADMIELIARHFRDQGVMLPGVTGLVATATAFANCWTALAGTSWRVLTHMRVYELSEVISPMGIEGKLVQAQPEHQATVADWAYLFDRLKRPFTPDEADQLAARHIEAGNLYLWCVDDQPVSMAAIGRRTRHGATVGLVYTPPEQRGHGYASAVVAGLSQHILASGKSFCALFTDLDNPTSNSIYQKIGYQPRDDFDELKFEV